MFRLTRTASLLVVCASLFGQVNAGPAENLRLDSVPLLYLWASPAVAAALGSEDLAASLIEELHSALGASGIPSAPIADSIGDQPSHRLKVLAVTAGISASSGLSALLVPADAWRSFLAGDSSRAQALVVVPLDPSDAAQSLQTFLMKIVEGLRSSALCHIAIESDPSPAAVSLDKIGFRGTTPAEILTWPDTLRLEATYPRHLKMVREIPMPTPGHYALVLQLKKRRIYHSPFFVPALVCFAGSIAAFFAESYYYDQYRSLGANDLRDNPDSFQQTFSRAKTAEYIAFGGLGLGAVCLSLSLLF